MAGAAPYILRGQPEKNVPGWPFARVERKIDALLARVQHVPPR